MNFSKRSIIAIAAVVAPVVLTKESNAAVFFSDSFEAGTGSPVAYPDLGDNQGGNMTGLNGWTNAGTANSLAFDTFNYHFFGTTGNNANTIGDLPNGGQCMYAPEGSSVRNTLSATTVLGETYVLRARIGDTLNDPASQMTARLFINGSEVASATGIATTNTSTTGGYVFDTLMTTPYVSTATGQSIEIRIDSASVDAAFQYSFVDEIELSNVIPEPTALGLLSVGAMGLLKRKRK